MKSIKKVYSVIGQNINQDDFLESVKNEEVSLSLVKTNFNKIIGYLCPIKLTG